MAVFSPHTDIYKIKIILDNINKVVFWLTLLLSILPLAFQNSYQLCGSTDLINIFNIIGIILFFVIEIVNEYILLPLADDKRRDDFIDNSFGSKFSIKNSIDYYDNQEVAKGIYKAAVNQFENCFFTYSLVKIAFIWKIIIPTLMLVLMSILAYYGFSQVPFALTILQSFFSANIIGNLVKHLILMNRLSSIQDSWLQLFQNVNLNEEVSTYQPHILRYWLQYETLHSKINADISPGLFKKNNAKLTKDWSDLKIKYNIADGTNQ
ncbi:hypothetical protein [Dyadobacter sp. CY347]|uniref:hypothetical protein n=1 Tax=Dyadobacter sp. CY347 TaxID=2909336 RepID=UPI001F1D273E|nr:hypothetical protein [Dyadobacter sp. CY347]MCF2490761.1 hypothetical protein [Dyadobacter sp. CY347]